MAKPRVKLVLFFANYGPYHFARLDACLKLAEEFKWELVPLEITRSGIEYEWKRQFDKLSFPILSVLGDKEPSQIKLSSLLQSLFTTLKKIQPDVIAIAGYSSPAMLATLAWCYCRQMPTILMSDSKENDKQRHWFSESLKAFLVRLFGSALVAGRPHLNYLAKLGMASESIFLGYDVVGNEIFSPRNLVNQTRPIKKQYFLAINRFINRKNLLFLLDAYADYRLKSNSPWDLVLCGNGQLFPEINQKINQLNLQNYVYLPGFLQQEQLLPYFAYASCFVHASLQEQWGLVVNEAMAASLPILVSNRCGCFEDLVIEGVNGFGFDPENHQQLTDLMLKMSSSAVDLYAMGQTSLFHIQKFSPDYFAQGLKQAVDHAILQNKY